MKVINLVGMLCGQGAEVLRINGEASVGDCKTVVGILAQMKVLGEICAPLRSITRVSWMCLANSAQSRHCSS